jgi:hypothetical protein
MMAGLARASQQGTGTQEGMDWTNPVETTSVPDQYNGNKVYNYEPMTMQDNGGVPSIDPSVLITGNEL